MAGRFSALAGGHEDGGGERWIAFDIPAQPLAQALDDYGRVTGATVLVEQTLISRRRSSDVKGTLRPDQALKILIAGSGLSIRYTSEDAFTLTPMRAALLADPRVLSGERDGDLGDDAYFAEVQQSLIQALCRQPGTQPGRYRLGMQLWIGAAGAIRAAHLLDSSGDAKRDAAIVDALRTTPVGPPPSSLPQPITVVLLPQHINPDMDCRRAAEPGR